MTEVTSKNKGIVNDQKGKLSSFTHPHDMTYMKDILENTSNVVSNPPDFLCMGTNSGNIFQNICKRKKIIQVWNDTRVSIPLRSDITIICVILSPSQIMSTHPQIRTLTLLSL